MTVNSLCKSLIPWILSVILKDYLNCCVPHAACFLQEHVVDDSDMSEFNGLNVIVPISPQEGPEDVKVASCLVTRLRITYEILLHDKLRHQWSMIDRTSDTGCYWTFSWYITTTICRTIQINLSRMKIYFAYLASLILLYGWYYITYYFCMQLASLFLPHYIFTKWFTYWIELYSQQTTIFIH